MVRCVNNPMEAIGSSGLCVTKVLLSLVKVSNLSIK